MKALIFIVIACFVSIKAKSQPILTAQECKTLSKSINVTLIDFFLRNQGFHYSGKNKEEEWDMHYWQYGTEQIYFHFGKYYYELGEELTRALYLVDKKELDKFKNHARRNDWLVENNIDDFGESFTIINRPLNLNKYSLDDISITIVIKYSKAKSLYEINIF